MRLKGKKIDEIRSSWEKNKDKANENMYCLRKKRRGNNLSSV